MPRVLSLLALVSTVVTTSACMSYPELVAGQEHDASLSPDGSVQTVGGPGAAPTDAASSEGDATRAPDDAARPPDDAALDPPAPPAPRSCDECAEDARCCEVKGGKGKGGRVIVCKPRDGACDDDD
jgi:hypothetical protein